MISNSHKISVMLRLQFEAILMGYNRKEEREQGFVLLHGSQNRASLSLAHRLLCADIQLAEKKQQQKVLHSFWLPRKTYFTISSTKKVHTIMMWTLK